MLIKFPTPRNSRGFTLVEVTVALGLGAISLMALLAVGDYFQKSRLMLETRATHTQLRNQIDQALSQKLKKCPNGPTSCYYTNACPLVLQTQAGTPLQIPGSKLAAPPAAIIGVSDQLTLAISSGTLAAGTPAPPFIVSGNAPVATARELADHLQYEVYLKGAYRNDKPGISRTFFGSVVLVGHRTLLHPHDAPYTGDELQSEIPIEFTVDLSSGSLLDCTTRSTDRTLAGGRNSVDHCLDAGGTAVPSTLGNLCRFSTPFTLAPLTPICDPGFVGNPTTGCTLDTSANATTMDTIPPCPAFAKDGTSPGSADVNKAQGSLYCDYHGTVVGTLVGACPDDPDDPTLGWQDDVLATPPTLATNIRVCKYSYQCETANPPGTTTVLMPPDGDGQTPTCQKSIAHCPGPPGSPWIETHPSGVLTCTMSFAYLNQFLIPPPSQPVCPAGFNALQSLPQVDAQWMDSEHIVCR